jgi:hypothetical protein
MHLDSFLTGMKIMGGFVLSLVVLPSLAWAGTPNMESVLTSMFKCEIRKNTTEKTNVPGFTLKNRAYECGQLAVDLTEELEGGKITRSVSSVFGIDSDPEFSKIKEAAQSFLQELTCTSRGVEKLNSDAREKFECKNYKAVQSIGVIPGGTLRYVTVEVRPKQLP